jgi:hypothetical protein
MPNFEDTAQLVREESFTIFQPSDEDKARHKRLLAMPASLFTVEEVGKLVFGYHGEADCRWMKGLEERVTAQRNAVTDALDRTREQQARDREERMDRMVEDIRNGNV